MGLIELVGQKGEQVDAILSPIPTSFADVVTTSVIDAKVIDQLTGEQVEGTVNIKVVDISRDDSLLIKRAILEFGGGNFSTPPFGQIDSNTFEIYHGQVIQVTCSWVRASIYCGYSNVGATTKLGMFASLGQAIQSPSPYDLPSTLTRNVAPISSSVLLNVPAFCQYFEVFGAEGELNRLVDVKCRKFNGITDAITYTGGMNATSLAPTGRNRSGLIPASLCNAVEGIEILNRSASDDFSFSIVYYLKFG